MGKDLTENLEYCIQKCHSNNIKLYVVLPRVLRLYTERMFSEAIQNIIKSDIDGLLVRSYGQFKEFKNCKKEIAVDCSANVFNSADMEFWHAEGTKSICLSPELNLQEIKSFADSNTEIIVYGHMPAYDN